MHFVATTAVALLLGAVTRVAAIDLPPPTPCPTCWVPPVVTSWQWQLAGTVDQSVDVAMYDIDLFDNTAAVVASLHAAGRKVICYVDAGSWENWRSDKDAFPAVVLGKRYDGYPDERWLDVRRLDLLGPILGARMDLCKAKGFDGVEFDNVEGFNNDTGFPLTADDQLVFNTWLANEAHARGLDVALKNDGDQAAALLPYFDWALVEECVQYGFCGQFVPFVTAGKAVMATEYRRSPKKICPVLNALDFNGIKKPKSLKARRKACR
ncbi:MAG: endo alpha-1,4 polygalactosaminidase [Candidatus Binatia bacterium]